MTPNDLRQAFFQDVPIKFLGYRNDTHGGRKQMYRMVRFPGQNSDALIVLGEKYPMVVPACSSRMERSFFSLVLLARKAEGLLTSEWST